MTSLNAHAELRRGDGLERASADHVARVFAVTQSFEGGTASNAIEQTVVKALKIRPC